MDQRSNLIWTFLIILAIAVVGWEVYNTYMITRHVKGYRLQSAQTILGSDEQLSQTVNQLETTLAERQAYQVQLTKDPLNLAEVIRSQRLLERLGFQEMEEEDEIRLSCTVLGETNSAIVKYGGRSHVISVGDIVKGYRVAEITEKEVVLKRGGEVMVLRNQKAVVPWETGEPDTTGTGSGSTGGTNNF
jgi:hypothetical protein